MPAPASSQPKVSVITIFLNAERFIAEAIESVLAQDFRDFEIILVDDGSTDASTKIARDYAARCAPVIRYLEHERHRNRGMSASRNLGLAAAQGEFVAFIDADDVWEQTKLTEQLAIMEAFPELGMVCGAVRYWSSWEGGRDEVILTGHVYNRVVLPPEAAFALFPLGKAAAPYSSNILLRREVVASLGGFEEQFSGLYDDIAFLVKLYLVAPVYFSDRVWLNYRQHDESCVAQVTRNGSHHEFRLSFLNWLEAYLRAMPQPDQRVFAALRRALLRYRHPNIYGLTCPLYQIMKLAWRAGRKLKNAVSYQRNEEPSSLSSYLLTTAASTIVETPAPVPEGRSISQPRC
jgi:glycosyltransferase involved in cell wall biosynthesis